MPDLKNKKIQQFIYMVFVAGIALLFIAKTDLGDKPAEETSAPVSPQPDLESRLTRVLSLADGVGEVKVIINYASGESRTIAKNKSEQTDENARTFEENVALDGENQPIVLRENSREIRGVLIVAQGGGSPEVKARLISAASALLGVEPHKIEVLKMRSQH